MRTRLYMKSFSEECLKTAASLHTTGSPSGVSWNRKSPAYFLSDTNKYINTRETSTEQGSLLIINRSLDAIGLKEKLFYIMLTKYHLFSTS